MIAQNRNKGRRGQVLIMSTLILVPLFGVLGMVTDFGYMHYVKMSAQTAAEAAAEAAIVDFHSTTGGASYSCGGNVVCADTPTRACAPAGALDTARLTAGPVSLVTTLPLASTAQTLPAESTRMECAPQASQPAGP